MTYRQIVSDIRESFKWVSGDNIVTDRFIASELRKEAILLIKREISQRKLLSSDNIFSTIPCLEMVEVPITECCDFNSFPCTVARSKYKIPIISESIYGLVCQGVYDIMSTTKFDYMDPDRYSNYLRMYGKDKKGKTKVFWKANGYLYVNQPDIVKVKLVAFFEEDIPKQLLSCSEDPVDCYPNPLDLEFKCPGYLISPVKKIVRETIRQNYKSSLQDNIEDDNDESK